MASIAALWLPILVAAVLVFLASFVLHMLLPFHRSDHRTVPGEDHAMDVMRPLNIPPGDYMLPRPPGSPSDPAFVAKVKRGPVVLMTVLPTGETGMGKQLALWFVYCVVVGVFAAYVTSRALTPGAPYLEAFRFAGTVAFIAYGMAQWQESIWYRRSWATTLRSNVDALIYGLLTGGAFGWLWPGQDVVETVRLMSGQ